MERARGNRDYGRGTFGGNGATRLGGGMDTPGFIFPLFELSSAAVYL